MLLPRFVEGLHTNWSGWDDLDNEAKITTAQTTMVDFSCARQTCYSWEAFLDETIEGAAHWLARWDLSSLQQPWCSKEDFMRTSFDRNYQLFTNSWELPSLLVNYKLRLAPP